MVEINERARRWRLVLGSNPADPDQGLSGDDAGIDACLSALYEDESLRRGGLGASAPKVARWLGDVRKYFPAPVVRVMQQDALNRLGLEQMLLEPEMLEAVEADVNLVATLISLKHVIPAKTKDTARSVVRKVVDELIAKLASPTREAVIGSLNRSVRNMRPRHNEIDWARTIRRNLKHYLPEYNTIIPEILVGFGRKRSSLRDIILCVDQSGSMANSVVYSSIFAAVLASLPAVSTKLVVFDTSVVDLSEELHDDPVDVLFGIQLGGGTDINCALGYCESLINRPEDTIVVLISDLLEGGNEQALRKRTADIIGSGVQMITLLALSDEGAPFYDHQMAADFAALGSPAFACTPELFPDLMAAAISKQDLGLWAAENDIVVSRGGDGGAG